MIKAPRISSRLSATEVRFSRCNHFSIMYGCLKSPFCFCGNRNCRISKFTYWYICLLNVASFNEAYNWTCINCLVPFFIYHFFRLHCLTTLTNCYQNRLWKLKQVPVWSLWPVCICSRHSAIGKDLKTKEEVWSALLFCLIYVKCEVVSWSGSLFSIKQRFSINRVKSRKFGK